MELTIGKFLLSIGDRTVVNQCRLFSTAVFDMAVEGVVTGIKLSTRKPTVEWRVAVVENTVPGFVPIDTGCGIGPEFFRLFQ